MERRTRKSKVMPRNVFVVLLLGGLLFAPSVRAEVGKYSISWHTFTTCGGGTSSYGSYTVRGSIGQPFAEKRAEGLAEGEHQITGGFWGGAYKSWYPIFVKADARGDDNGTSWAHAFTSLQDALDATQYCTEPEIVVAAGTYCPDYYGHDDEGKINPNYKYGRGATFELENGVETYGGFPAGGGSWDDRDVAVNETILSGDLNNNGRDDHDAYHVVTGSNADPNAVLDGFTITGGNANEDPYNPKGGGMYNSQGSPTLIHCTFRGNTAKEGGGVYNKDNNAKPKFVYCTFTENNGKLGDESHGGAMHNSSSSPKVVQSLFVDNSADYGGAIYNYQSDLSMVSCNIIGNHAEYFGGGIHSTGSIKPPDFSWKNCIFWDNTHKGNNNTTQAQIYPVSRPNWDDLISHCCLQGLESTAYANGNIGTDPNMVNLIAGDYHLNLDSPCINTGDPDFDPTDNEYDMDGQPRVVGCRVDMGIDEYVLTGDFNFSGTIDIADYTFFARYWLSDYCDDLPGTDMDWCYGTDLDKNHVVANPDLFLFTENWLFGLPNCN
jgi:hypothetical protein